MVTRVLPAVGDLEAARSVAGSLGRLPDTEALPPAADSERALAELERAARGAGLPEVVLVHERIAPLPALELIRRIAVGFPAVAVVLATGDTSPSLYSAAMDAGARGVLGLPLRHEELAARVEAAAGWAAGVRRHLGAGGAATGAELARPGDPAAGAGGARGTVVAVAGAKGGVGTTVAAVHLALAARAHGRETALLDMDLQAGDVASYLDVRFRRSVADLAGIDDLSPRVLQEAVFPHESGLGLLLAPADGERGEEVDDRAARQIVAALRARYEVVVVDCGSQLGAGNAAAVESADRAVLLSTPDVVSVRAARRTVRMWERLRVRTAEETLTVVNRASRHTDLQPPLVSRIVGTPVAAAAVPAHFKELQSAVDAGRLHDLDAKGTVRQALWRLAAELGLTGDEATAGGAGTAGARAGGFLRRPRGSARAGAPSHQAAKAGAADAGDVAGPRGAQAPPQALPPGSDGQRGSVTVEFAGILPVALVVVALLWQCVLLGYTFSLAGNAADEAARSQAAAAAGGGGGAACRDAATARLPAGWRKGASVDCRLDGHLWKAEVGLRAPVLFPGSARLPFTVDGTAGAAEEG